MSRSATVPPAASAARAQLDTDAIEVHWRRVRATTVRAAVAGWLLAVFVSMWLRGFHHPAMRAATVAIGLVIILLFGIAPHTTIRTWRRLCGGVLLVLHAGTSMMAIAAVVRNRHSTPLALVCAHTFRLILAMPLFLHWAVPLAMTIVSMGTVPAFLLIKHNASVTDTTVATLQTTAVGLIIMHHMYYRDAAIVRTATDTAHKRHLLARVAHDFGTPLTAVKTLAYALPRGTPGRGQLRLFIEQLEMLRSMIVQEGQLMAGATLQPTNRPIADFEAEVVDFSVNVARLSANRRDPVDIRVETAPEIRGSIVSDVCWLRCALFNLITNSVKFTTSRILVCTTLVRGGTMLRVEVHDDGRGIDDADAARLFQMYSQLQDDAGGSGIGLKSTLELVHDLGGTCEVIGHGSRLGGACFRLDIPYTPVHVVPAATLSIAPAVEEEKNDDARKAVEEKKNDDDAEIFPDDYGNGCSVLFVEDITMLCKMASACSSRRASPSRRPPTVRRVCGSSSSAPSTSSSPTSTCRRRTASSSWRTSACGSATRTRAAPASPRTPPSASWPPPRAPPPRASIASSTSRAPSRTTGRRCGAPPAASDSGGVRMMQGAERPLTRTRPRP